MARGWVNFKWWASAGLLAQIRHGCDPTNLRWALSRSRRTSLIVRTLLSILAELASARTGTRSGDLCSIVGFVATGGGGICSTTALTFLGRPLGRLMAPVDAGACDGAGSVG